MLETDTTRALAPTWPRTPLTSFMLQSGGLAIALWVSASWLLGSSAIVLLAFGLCIALATRLLSADFPHRVLGLCNTVTLTRTAMMVFAFGALWSVGDVSPWIVFWVGLVAFSLDGVDGWLARRSGLCSEFGARFDRRRIGRGFVAMAAGHRRDRARGAGLGLHALCLCRREPLSPRLEKRPPRFLPAENHLFLICPLAPPVLIAPVSLIASALSPPRSLACSSCRTTPAPCNGAR